MRRKDREVSSEAEVLDILERCDTVRIAMQGEAHPYVVPISFGLEVQGQTPVIYFHCAAQGMKIDLLKANPHVCVEGDILIGVEKVKRGITARYESVIGFGVCELVSSKEEVIHGLQVLNAHYGFDDYPVEECSGVSRVLVGKVVLESITGKRNLSQSV